MASAFDNLAPRVCSDLCRDFGLTPTQAAGIVGNLGAESGLRAVQEGNPTSGRGGYGWAQWTGPRRVSFESWCRAQGFALDSYAANYGYLKQELSDDYAHTITQLKKTTTIKAAAETFEAFYEKAGVKRMEARISLANRALALYLASPYSKEAPVPVPPAVLTAPATPWYKSKVIIAALVAAASPLIARFVPGLAAVDPEQTTQAVVQQARDEVPAWSTPQQMQPEAWAQPVPQAVNPMAMMMLSLMTTAMGVPKPMRDALAKAVPSALAMVEALKQGEAHAEAAEPAPVSDAPMPSRFNGT
jgi:hypothetical protein